MSVQVNVDADGNNIVGDAANGPSIAVDPANPDKIVIGWRQFDSVQSEFREGRDTAYSDDGGSSLGLPGVLDPGVFRTYPVLGTDLDGNVYYYSQTTESDRYIAHLSSRRMVGEPGRRNCTRTAEAKGGSTSTGRTHRAVVRSTLVVSWRWMLR